MMNYDYNICGLRLRVITDRELAEQGSIFRAAFEKEEVAVTVRAVEEILPPEEADVVSVHREYPVWRKEQCIMRETWDLFREKPHFRADYELSEPASVQCLVREADWAFATKEKYLWPGMMLQYILIHHGGFICHASYIEWKEEGILFVGASGVGKSTQARLWENCRKAHVINGDKAGIRLGQDGKVSVHGVPFSGTSGICKNVSLPLKAIVVLSQAEENKVVRMSGGKAIAAIYPNVFVDRAVPEDSRQALEVLLEVLSRVPVYALACTPDDRAVETLENVLSKSKRRNDV